MTMISSTLMSSFQILVTEICTNVTVELFCNYIINVFSLQFTYCNYKKKKKKNHNTYNIIASLK